MKIVCRITLCFVALSASAHADDAQSAGWSYRPVVRPEVPANIGSAQAIDAFLQAELSARTLTFSQPAARHEVLRRATYDLIGLPPTPEELDRFLADDRPDAYEQLIDRLLASPHYGERWGRHWLDVVRYADSAGFNADPMRPAVYKYRDYVIQSFNNDVPYDRFLREQLAGDELAADRPEGWIAVGFLRLGPDESNASNILLARQELLNEVTATVANVFLAQSLGCAQCHDHKFEPLTQRDFYRLQAFFAGLIPLDGAAVGKSEQLAEHAAKQQAWEQSVEPLRAELRELEHAARIEAAGDRRMKFPEIVLTAIDTPVEQRTALQHQFAFFCERQIPITDDQIRKALSKTQQTRRQEILAELSEQEKQKPKPAVWLEAFTTTDGQPVPPTFDLDGGNYERPLEEVTPGFPAVLTPESKTPDVSPPRAGTSGRRTALANWLADPRHPLTARVMVNRIWQGHFGRGIAPNANDFGTQSPLPSHPQLLDWLAAEFVEPTIDVGGPQGKTPWSIKRLHKLIMLSAAYRQAGDRGEETDDPRLAAARKVDRENRWYWAFPSRRLEAEAVRDALLAVSGRLNPATYGPAVQPELPRGYSAREAWKASANPADRQRRSIYILAKRNLPFPLLNDFDLPDMHESCARRMQTTTAPQALTLLNSELVLAEARSFAGRLLRDDPRGDAAEIVPAAYRLAFGRSPGTDEQLAAAEFLKYEEQLLESAAVSHESLPIGGFPKFLSPARAAAIVDFCHVLLNANEFLYVD